MPAQSPSVDDRRRFRRVNVCIPASIRIVDERGRQAITDPNHAVISDVSPGGVCLHLVGDFARMVRDLDTATHRFEVLFVPKELRHLGRLVCTSRWCKPAGGKDAGWIFGLQFGSTEPLTVDQIVRECSQYRTDPPRWRGRLLAACAIIGAALIAYTLGGHCGDAAKRPRGIAGLQEEDTARGDLERLSQDLDQQQVTVQETRGELANCEKELKQCVSRLWKEAQREPSSGEKPKEAAATPPPPAPANLVVLRLPPSASAEDRTEVVDIRLAPGALTGAVRRDDRGELPALSVQLRHANSETPCTLGRPTAAISTFSCPVKPDASGGSPARAKMELIVKGATPTPKATAPPVDSDNP